mgnify:CR=1 FL=1
MKSKKTASILKKFLLFNLTTFSILGLFTIFYLKAIQPNLVKKRAINHKIIINNTVDHLERLNVDYSSNGIRTFLLSTRFLFQSLDRVQFYDSNGELIGDTNILDLDQNVFSRSDVVIEEAIDGKNSSNEFSSSTSNKKTENNLNIILEKYDGDPLTISEINKNFDELFLINDFIDYLTKNVCVVKINVKDEKISNNLFESLNYKGKRLKIIDLIRNYFFIKVSSKNYEFFSQVWEELESILNELMPFDDNRMFDTIAKDLFANFLICNSGKHITDINLYEIFTSNFSYYKCLVIPGCIPNLGIIYIELRTKPLIFHFNNNFLKINNKKDQLLQIVFQSYVHNTRGYCRSVIEAIKEILNRYNRKKNISCWN